MDWSLVKESLDWLSKLSIVIAAFGFLLSIKALRLQHERSRREKALSAIQDFNRALTPRSAAARKLARHLTPHQLESIDQGREFTVPPDHRDLLYAALPDQLTQDQLAAEEGARLTRHQSYLLRWELISQLNTCEVAAQYWVTDVGDKRIIEDELAFLLDPTLGENVLTTCKIIATKDNFPALHALINELETKRGKPAVREPMKTP